MGRNTNDIIIYIYYYLAIFLDANYLFYNLLAKDLESLSVMATHSVELLNNLITIMISFLVSKVSMQEFLIGKVEMATDYTCSGSK